jgi:hypothetical protein
MGRDITKDGDVNMATKIYRGRIPNAPNQVYTFDGTYVYEGVRITEPNIVFTVE